MAAKKTTPARGKAVADAFRAAAASDDGVGKWEVAKRTLVDAIETSDSAAELEKLLRSESVSDTFFDEDEDWPEVAHALVRLASSLEPKEGARVLGWVARGSAFLPYAIVRPDRSSDLSLSRKQEFAQALVAHQAFLAKWLVDESHDRRAAAAYAIAASGSSSEVELEALKAAINKEKNATALASELLALGVVLFRLEGSNPKAITDAHSIALAKRTDKNALVRLTAITLLAFSGAALGPEVLTQVIEHLLHPFALPVAWGWHSAQPPAMKSDWLALSLLCWAKVEVPEPAIGVLLEQKVETSSLGFVALVGDALIHLAFIARGRPLPRYIFVPGETDTIEQQVALLLSEEPWSRTGLAEKKLGLPRRREQVAALIAGEQLEYRPLEVQGISPPRRWHYARIWAAVVFDGFSLEVACRTVVDTCSPVEAIALAVLDGHAKLPAQTQLSSNDQWQRGFAFALAICETLRKRGFDVTSAVQALEGDRLANLSVIAAVYLTEFGAKLPSEKVALVGRGLSIVRSPEPMLSLLLSLPEDLRHQILHATRINALTLPFVKTCLDAPIVRGLVLFATGAWGKDQGDAVLDILQQGGTKIASLLEAIDYPSEQIRAGSTDFVKKALERLAANEPNR